MQRLEVSGAVRPIYGSLGVKRLICKSFNQAVTTWLSRILTRREDKLRRVFDGFKMLQNL